MTIEYEYGSYAKLWPGLGALDVERVIIEYGSLKFLSEGFHQLGHAIVDAQYLSKERFFETFIMGFTRQRKIMVAPKSERARFIDPLAVMIIGNDFRSICDMHPLRFQPFGLAADISDTERASCDPVTKLADMLCDSFVRGSIQYGRFEAGSPGCITILEKAVEDSAKMARDFGEESRHVILYKGAIRSERRWNLPGTTSVEIRPQDFLDGDVLLRDRVSDVARKVYEKFSEAVQTGHGVAKKM